MLLLGTRHAVSYQQGTHYVNCYLHTLQVGVVQPPAWDWAIGCWTVSPTPLSTRLWPLLAPRLLFHLQQEVPLLSLPWVDEQGYLQGCLLS